MRIKKKDNKHHTANFPLVCTSHNFSSQRFCALNPRHYFANLFLAVLKGEGVLHLYFERNGAKNACIFITP
jgi:hypothetical protein